MSRKVLQRIFSFILVAGMLLGFVAPASAQPSLANVQEAPMLSAEKVESLVLDEIAAAGHTQFFVWMSTTADLTQAAEMRGKADKGQFVFDTLRSTAEQTQKDLRGYLDSQGVAYRPFYIVNTVFVKGGNLDLVMQLASRSDVSAITANHQYQLEEPFIELLPEGPSPEGIEANISWIYADEVWGMGYTGQGTVLAGNDTGLSWDHSAIIDHYRGWDGSTADHNYNWWDATGSYPAVPNDGHGHGTHTTGTMVGDDGGSNQIGVAPGAQTIHCKNMDDGGSGDDNTFLTCFEWDLAPWDLAGANPDPSKAPDAVNNSWGYGGGGYDYFRGAINALQAAGIAVEVSAGNEGFSCSTLRSPGDYQQVLTTGSVDHDVAFPGVITYEDGWWSSSRGPSSLDGDYFPDIMAPGNGIRSSLPGDTYASWGGTSMAGPHATALIGLIWSACPAFTGLVTETYQIIVDTAEPLTGQTGLNCGGDYTDGPNNDWGNGTINAKAAVDLAIGLCAGTGTLAGTVTDSATSLPLEGVDVLAEWDGGNDWFLTTDADGTYELFVPIGIYTVTASLYGYGTEQVTGVEVEEDLTTVQDFALDPMPFYLLSGYVTDALTGWPLYASLDIDGYPGGTIWSDPVTGYYEVELPGGTVFDIHVAAWSPGYLDTFASVGPLTAATQQDFELDVDAAGCAAPGYELDCTYYENFDSDDGDFVASGTTSWAWGMPTSGPGAAHSGFNVWATNLAGSYNISEDGYITSPLIDLSSLAGQGVLVSWWQWLDSESGYDYADVQVSNDGGTSWTPIYGPVSGSIDLDWTHHEITLDSSYAVNNFQIRYHFITDSSVVYEGWYIDSLCIMGVPENPPVHVQDFEANNGGYVTSGTTSWEWGAPTSGPGAAHSGANVWATNLDGYYSDGEDGYVTSPVIDLSAYAGQAPTVKWWEWRDLETCCDYAEVQVSNDGGTNWSTIYGPAYSTVLAWTQASSTLDPVFSTANFQIRFHFFSDSSVYYEGWYIDDFSIAYNPPVDYECEALPGGLVVGNVYDENTNAGLVGAEVSNDEGGAFSTVETPDDPALDDGFYQIFTSPGDHDFTASLSGYVDDSATVTVVDGENVEQDFFLGAGILSADPASIHVTVPWEGSTASTLDLANDGASDVSFEIYEKDRGFVPALNLYQTTSNTSRSDAEVAPVSRMPLMPLALGDWLFDIDFETPTGNNLLLGVEFVEDSYWVTGADPASGVGFLYKLDVDGNLIATYSQAAPCTGWGGRDLTYDGTYLYYGCDDGNIYQADPATGAPTGFTIATPIFPPRALAYDPDSGHFWTASWDSSIYEIDSSGTVINTFAPVGLSTYGMAWDPWSDGGPFLWLWSQDGPDPLLMASQLNPSTGLLTGVSFLGVGAAGEMAGGATISGDILPGQAVFLGMIQGVLDRVSAYDLDAVATMPDVTWLSESPITGTVLADGVLPIDIGFDASVPEVDQPGDYFATLNFKNDTPYGTLPVPVTMTVEPPDDMGKVTGLILDNCLQEPIEDVMVLIEGGTPITVTYSNADGQYTAWLVEGTYPLTFTLANYLDFTAEVTIVAGEVTTLDVNLIPDRPCVIAAPDMFEVWVITGTTEYAHSTGLDLENPGGVDLSFGFMEIDGGYEPPAEYVLASSDGSARGLSEFGAANPKGVAAPHAPVDVLLNQAPNLVNGLFSDSDCDLCGTGQQSIAENFALPYGGSIEQIVFWTGYYSTNVPLATDLITVIFHEDVSGSVGDAIYTEADVAYERVTTGVWLFGVEEWMHTLTLATPLDLPAGNYWVEIYNDTTGSVESFFWETGDIDPEYGLTGSAWATSTPGSGWSYDVATDLSIQLIGEFPDVPWFWQDPITGTVKAQEAANVGILFTAVVTDPLPLGTYNATLVLQTNDPLAERIDIPVTMHIVEEYLAPTAAFTATQACLGDAVLIDNLSDPGIPPDQTTYEWDFGDGSTSTLEEPGEHTYAAAGDYTITLEACNIVGCTQATQVVTVIPDPTASFTFVADLLVVTFTNTSLDGDTFAWDFGDGTTSAEVNPVHTYAAAGTYTVILTVSNDCGVATYEAQVSVIKAYFYYLPLQYKYPPLP